MAIKFNRSFNINRIVKRLVGSILALYVGGTIISVFGDVMNATASPFYQGLSLIGWTVSDGTTAVPCADNAGGTPATYCITDTGGSGVLAVIGIIALAQIVTEFISW